MTAISSSFDVRVNVGNVFNQISVVLNDSDDGKDSDFIGATAKVGDGEFNDLIGGKPNYYEKRGVNDAGIIFAELVTGDGIDGVGLIGLDGDSFTISVQGVGGSVDYMIFKGMAAMNAIAAVDAAQGVSAGATGLDLNGSNKGAQFAVLDWADAASEVKIGAGGEFNAEVDLTDTVKAGDQDFADFLEGLLTEGGYTGVEVIDVDGSSISLALTGSQSTDTLLVKNLEGVLDSLQGGPLNDLINSANDFEIDGPTNVPDTDLWDSFAFKNQLKDGDPNNQTDDNQLLDALVAAGEEISDDDETISLVGIDSDSSTFSYETGGTIDYFVFDYM